MVMLVKHALAAVAATTLVYGAWMAWRASKARTLAEYVEAVDRLPNAYQIDPMPLADEAVRLSQSDPESHYARGIALAHGQSAREAIAEFERAIELRPKDYKLWIRLGSAREDSGDENSALSAYKEAVRHAPIYAQPRWRLGNVMLRLGQSSDGFVQLRKAAQSDPSLLGTLIDLAFRISSGDARRTEELVQPDSDSWRVALASVFGREGKSGEAIALFRAANRISDDELTALMNAFLTSKQFPEAYEVWVRGHDRNQTSQKDRVASIIDGGFENRVSADNSGFGWVIQSKRQSVQLSLDRLGPHSGSNSLRVDWKGEPNLSESPLAQLVLVSPNDRYRLLFSARGHDLVTGGPPIIEVADASSAEGTILARSVPLPAETTNWQDYSVEFAAPPSCRAIRISLYRESCSSPACPIFGELWLDDFILVKL